MAGVHHKNGVGKMPTEEDLDRHIDRAMQKAGVIPQRGRGVCRSAETDPEIRREEVRQVMRNVLYWYGRKTVKTDEECADRLNEYFSHISETGEIATYEKMCLALGADRTIVERWEKGEKGAARAAMIREAKNTLASYDAELANNGKIPQVVYIFRSKNFYGMKDQVEISASNVSELQSAEEIKKKYIDER